MIVDPDGRGLNDHWVKTGAALLTGTILHVLYAEPNKTLRGVAGVLSDPSAAMPETIQRMLSTEHDPDGSMRWRSYRGEPIRTHPIVAESMRELLNKSENERSGVFSTAMSFLSLYRDPVVAANTERSEFRISDLMNHDRPGLALPRRASFQPRPPSTADAADSEPDRPHPHDHNELPRRKSHRRLQTSALADAGRISGTRPAGSFLRRARVDRGLWTSRLSHRPGLEPDSCGIRSRRSDHEQLSHTSRVHPEPRRNRALTLANGRRGDRQARAAHLLELWNFNFGTRDFASAVDHRRSNAPPRRRGSCVQHRDANRQGKQAPILQAPGVCSARADSAARGERSPERSRGSAISPEANHRGKSVSPAPILNGSAKSVQDISDSARLL